METDERQGAPRDAAEHRVGLEEQEQGFLASVDGAAPIEVIGRWQPGQLRFRGTIDGRPVVVRVSRDGRGWRVTTRSTPIRVPEPGSESRSSRPPSRLVTML